jgi:hypothetical protein
MKNYYFGVVKFGIGARDSMLTRDNFMNAWFKPKPNWKDETKMGMDESMEDSTEPPLEPNDMTVDTTVPTLNGNDTVSSSDTRTWKVKKRPMFAFQKQGVGLNWSRRNHWLREKQLARESEGYIPNMDRGKRQVNP